jgi:hypothetical protein
MIARSNGIGHMNNIPRPDAVFMQWGLGDFYYQDEDNFPRQDPLLIPKSSAGIAHMEIEIDTIPIMRQNIHGVGHFTGSPGGTIKGSQWQTVFAGSRKHYLPSGHYSDIFGRFDYGVTITAFQAHDWQSDGVGHMVHQPTLAYFLRWQKAGDSGFVQRVGGLIYVGLAGAEGHFFLAGPRQVSSVSAGRATLINHMTGRFAVPVLIHGVATAVLVDEGGVIVILYGDMLAQNFSVPTPAYGQLWPRRMHLYGLPV